MQRWKVQILSFSIFQVSVLYLSIYFSWNFLLVLPTFWHNYLYFFLSVALSKQAHCISFNAFVGRYLSFTTIHWPSVSSFDILEMWLSDQLYLWCVYRQLWQILQILPLCYLWITFQSLYFFTFTWVNKYIKYWCFYMRKEYMYFCPLFMYVITFVIIHWVVLDVFYVSFLYCKTLLSDSYLGY